ncbi:MAG: preprotein translocase subunit YajC [Bacteroidota bacterium]
MLEIILLQAGGNSGLYTNLLFIAIIAITWFFFIRPQSKKAKEEQKFTSELEKGMEVVTKSGVIGRISKVEEKIVTIQVDQKTFIPFTRGAISKELTDAFHKDE